VLEGSVGGQDGVVGLDDRGGGLRSGINAELELALLAVVDGQTLHEESTETRTGTTTEGVEDEEALETNTVVGNTADLVKDAIDELLADGVVATGVVVGSILLASDHHLGVEEVSVGTGADLIDDVGLEIAVDGAGDILALT
jgi:alkanesulfonate monooxygenase SsuD/methylene tetrahydromethanopterin reductase-like flavin-dependent oxidoreductase (luciferase family)